MDWTAPCAVPECNEGRIITQDERGRTFVGQCACARKRVVRKRNGEPTNGFPKNDPPPMLADFDPGWGTPPKPGGRTFQSAAAKLGAAWLDAWAPGVGALIYGVTGSGKTRFATALANELTLRGQYVKAQMVCVASHIPSGWPDKRRCPWRDSMKRHATQSTLLVIDNLRADFSPRRMEEIAELAEAAVRERRAVIFTTTLDPSQLRGSGAWGDICSRIGEIAGRWRFNLGGTDFRQPATNQPDHRQRQAGDFD